MTEEEIDFLEQHFSNIFVDSISSMMKSMLDINVEKSATERRYGLSLGENYYAAIGVIGDIKANILYEFERTLAVKIAEILNNRKEESYDNKDSFYLILRGALSEIANVISGNALGLMSKENIDCDITPSLLYYGHGLQILPKNQEIINISFSSKFGKIVLSIVMEVNKK